ncbi:MAG: hypothetical protein KDC97_13710, partial [Confluentibacter sp.]|nr:hypothetical protein [Confluentibacter sp.]
KGERIVKKVMNEKLVDFISPVFSDQEEIKPFLIGKNLEFAYCGSVLSGEGFLLTIDEAKKLISINPTLKDVINPYMVGDDLNNSIGQIPSRYVINFRDWTELNAKKYKECYEIVFNKVKPIRDKAKRKTYRDKWWQFAEKAVNLYKKIENQNNVIAVARTSKTLAFDIIKSNSVFSANLTVFTNADFADFSIFQSNLHSAWAWKYGTTLKSDLIYAPSDIVNNFPYSINTENQSILRTIGENYQKNRKYLMASLKLGLTKTYNLFHSNGIQSNQLDLKDKQVVALQKHLEKTPNTISFEEAVQGIIKLRELHKQMDEAVLEAYGWQDIALRHDFYEVDYLPENDRVRYTIHPEARKEVLKRLLLLNHERYEEEIKQGFHKKKDVVAFHKQNGKPIPEGTTYSDVKTKKAAPKKVKTNVAQEPPAQYGLFSETTNELKEASKVTIQKADGSVFKYHIIKNAIKGSFTGEFKQNARTAYLAEVMLGRKVGDAFAFGGVQYKILEVI